jgi:hypothetical protein
VAVSLHVVSKVVTRRNKDGSVKQYRYYQLVRSSREGRKVKTEFISYLGKLPFITRRKAAQIGLNLEDLQKVKSLGIVVEEADDEGQRQVASKPGWEGTDEGRAGAVDSEGVGDAHRRLV